MFAKRTAWDLEANPLSRTLSRVRSAGTPVIDLTASNPTACELAYDSGKILESLASPAALAYEPATRGLAAARGAVSAYYGEHGAEVPAESIVLTTGTSEAYSFAMRLLCDPGDEILVPEPSYPLLAFLAGIQDVTLVPYPLVYENGWRMDFPAIERATTPRTRAVVVIHPNNPTGNFCPPGDARRLSGWCAERGLAILADEVFLDFALDGPPPPSFAAMREALTFTLSGLSKIAGLPQMKASWMAVSGPGPAKEQALERLEVIADTFLSMNAPIQLAMPAFLDLRRGFQEQLLSRIRQNLAELDRQLAGQSSYHRLAVEGGWYVVLRVETDRTDEDLAIELLATQGVYIHPGHFYDFPGEGYLIASLICPPGEFAAAIGRLLALC
ncbi:MAG TPA: pyridoxal phosphate-dependent aminotransferase [Patescibacteria group bacterium]|nr:pyridoxal phosphate-dependent aminotransferase [Patescibacteria group bacterium]